MMNANFAIVYEVWCSMERKLNECWIWEYSKKKA
jgi:hypothetical protein